MSVASRFIDYVIDFFAYVGGALCIIMMLAVSVDVIGRYFIRMPILGIVEATQFMMLWVVFSGVAWVLKKKGHIHMDFILQMVKPKVQNWLTLITSLICLITSLVTFWYSLNVVIGLFQDGILESGDFPINSGYLILAVPIGCLLLVIQFSRIVREHWRLLKVP